MAVDTPNQALTGLETPRSRPTHRKPAGGRSAPYVYIAPFFILFGAVGLFPLL